MRSIATIFLLFLLTVTQTPVGQVLKLPVLMEHFYKHKQRDKISLLKFLHDHYAIDHNDADQAEDEQLPFKNMVQPGIGFAIIPKLLIGDFNIAIEMPTKVVLQNLYIQQQHLASIFHPPRI